MAVEHAGNRSQPSLDWVAMTTGTRLDIDLNTAIPEQLRAKQLIGLFVHGTALVAGRPPRSIELTVDGVAHPVIAHGMPSPTLGPKARAGFWGIVPLAATVGDRRARIGARASLGHGSAVEAPLGAVELLAEASEPVAAPAGTGSRTVAICMATHEPPAELLRRQLDSLRAQTHDDWICLISDDASGGERFAALETAIDGDRRFVVSRSDRRLGAYENFHRALRMVPGEVPYVALCDQDDRWHPDKLSTLLEALGDANLVFSDMRITAPDGTLIAPTYWTRRQPNHANFASLLLGNSVTGAASLFPRRLLDQALPFPPRLGNLYHDHWLALVARALGEIAYVPRPLYDYVQHPEAVIGHAGANRGVVGGGAAEAAAGVAGPPAGAAAHRMAADLLRRVLPDAPPGDGPGGQVRRPDRTPGAPRAAAGAAARPLPGARRMAGHAAAQAPLARRDPGQRGGDAAGARLAPRDPPTEHSPRRRSL